MTMREDYEKWLRDNALVEYPSDPTNKSLPWAVWQAATAIEREACAEVCEAFGATLEDNAGSNYAEEIRARDT